MKKNISIILITLSCLIISIVFFIITKKEQSIDNSTYITSTDDIPDILKIKQKQADIHRDIILWFNCKKFDQEAEDYCHSEQIKLLEFYKQTTWESVLKQWDEYIKEYDCMQIIEEVWQTYCIEKQQELWNQ